MSKAVEAEHVSYSYGSTPVLRGVSFDVNAGDFFVIIGPNGSGKTTLLKLICGILKPGEGRVKALGRPIREYSRKALARHVALVPQAFPADFPFTVTELVLMGRSPHQGVLGIENEGDMEAARRAMAFTGVEHLARRRLEQLSGGERQRVFISRAICQEPRIILLDEPTASLDLAHQVRVMDLMERLKEERGITVVMVSHDVNLAAMYGDFLLLLKEGEIVKMGLPEEVLTYTTLEQAYGCTLLVRESPLGRFPQVTIVPGKCMVVDGRSENDTIKAAENGDKESDI
jgi:cobalamin transport system ATP-binding protein